ncbi:mitochondrial distribution and morphology proteins-domain-containing protein [Phlyctochytrium arcticum]|nr:mitochondrial distribution and morphology proteins-domain-containing protein [Phlyctochytrium arcticum]
MIASTSRIFLRRGPIGNWKSCEALDAGINIRSIRKRHSLFQGTRLSSSSEVRLSPIPPHPSNPGKNSGRTSWASQNFFGALFAHVFHSISCTTRLGLRYVSHKHLQRGLAPGILMYQLGPEPTAVRLSAGLGSSLGVPGLGYGSDLGLEASKLRCGSWNRKRDCWFLPSLSSHSAKFSSSASSLIPAHRPISPPPPHGSPDISHPSQVYTSSHPPHTDSSSNPSWRVARAHLLDTVSGFWPRLRLRIRLFLMGSMRPWRADDIFAMFSWIFVGHTLFLLIGTTTFLSILIGVANSLQFQAYVANAISDYITQETGMKVTFESAIVPRWKEGVIRLENVSILCNDETWRELKNDERRRQGLSEWGVGELDTNWTFWDLSLRHIDVTLSLWRWLDGKGLIKECTLKGVRGEINRQHVTFDPEWKPVRREAQAGDFELARFVVEDLLITIRNPQFRPYSVSIFNAELPRLRKQWLLYDIMRADIMNGMFDNCLFSVHKPQGSDFVVEDGLSPEWAKMSRLKLNGLPIDHLNGGVEGPFGWITRGFLDIDLQLLFPQTDNDNLLNLLRDEVNDWKDVALDKLEEAIATHPETANRHESMVMRHYKQKEDSDKQQQPSIQQQAQEHVMSPAVGAPFGGPEGLMVPLSMSNGSAGRSRGGSTNRPAMVMLCHVRLHDLKASVPLVSPHISWMNSALIRPIVGYLNAVKTSIHISFSAKMDLDNFEGAWTVYQASLVDVLGEEVGRALTDMVAAQRAKHMKRIGIWSLQSVTKRLAILMEYARGARGWTQFGRGEGGAFAFGRELGIGL